MGRQAVAAAALVAGVALVGSCGGTAVLDGAPQGAGGSQDAGAHPVCVTPDPVGTLTQCGGGVGPDQCVAALCDSAGNTWESSCTATGCACMFNGVTRCTCISDGPGHPCDGRTPLCCPPPFPTSPL